MHTTLKLLGNTALLLPLGDVDVQGRFILTNKFKKPVIKYRVVMVGPGGWVKNPKTKKRHWEAPEVEVGDTVLCRCALDGAKYAFEKADDGNGKWLGLPGCYLVDARDIEMKWKEDFRVNALTPDELTIVDAVAGGLQTTKEETIARGVTRVTSKPRESSPTNLVFLPSRDHTDLSDRS